MHSIFERTPLATAILLTLHSPLYSLSAMAMAGDPVGNEFQVNTEVDNNQQHSSVAMDADGDFVIVWQSDGQDSDANGVYAQRYHANGSKAGNEFLVNTETSGDQKAPSVALTADGDFVIVWSGNGPGDVDGVYARRYKADGTAIDQQEFLVNTHTSDEQFNPVVALAADDGLVIVWQSNGQDNSGYGVYAQRYHANGSKAGNEFLVNTETSGDQKAPNVALAADGDFVIVWQSDGQDGDGNGVYARRYKADGTAIDQQEFLVNTATNDNQEFPDIALTADGDFVIVWQSDGQDGDDNGVYAQRYNADGSKVGNEFLVNKTTFGDQSRPSVALDTKGDFVITWRSEVGKIQSNDFDGIDFDVYVRRYKANGNTIDNQEFLVNTETDDDQEFSAIALDADGDFVVVWTSEDQDKVETNDDEGDSDNGFGVYAQRYAGDAVDLSVIVQDDIDPVVKGNSFAYSLMISNNGNGIARDVNVSLSQSIPTGLTYMFDSVDNAGWVCSQDGTDLNCNKPSMAAGESNTLTVTVSADSVGTFTTMATAIASDTQTDMNNTDNSDTETTTVTAISRGDGDSNGSSGRGGGGGALGSFSLLMMVLLGLRRCFWR